MFSVKVSAQVIYVSTTEDQLFKLDINTCDLEFLTIVNSEVFDITFHPNGNLYGISGSGNFYNIDTVTGGVTYIHNFDGQVFNSLTSAGNGLIYTIGNKGELWSYDIDTDDAIYHGEIGFPAAGDLTFYEGNLYVAIVGNKIVLIDIENTLNSSIIIEQDVAGDIFGIVSFADDCSDVNSYAITNGNSNIYQIDYADSSLNFVCQLGIEIGGGASTFEFLASAPIIIEDVSMVNPLCNFNNGEISINATGGTGDISYSIDGVNYQDIGAFEDLGIGDYTVFIKDESGCVIKEEVELLGLLAPEISGITFDHSICDRDNGSITISAIGGTGQLVYSIDGINFQMDNIFTNLQADVYSVVIRDENDCEVSAELEIEDNGIPHLELITLTNTTCNENNGVFEVTVNGGSPPFSYSIDQMNFQAVGNFEDLMSGNYTVEVIDANGCQDSLFILIEPSELPQIGDFEVFQTTCGQSNGSFSIDNQGSDQDILYSIDDLEYQEDNTFSNLAPGTYTVFVKDGFGCDSNSNVDILGSDEVSILNIDLNSADCGKSNGSFEVLAKGGNELKLLSLNGGIFDSEFRVDNLISGTYEIEIKNEKDCKIDTLIIIEEKDCPIFIANTFSPNFDGVNDIFSIYPDPGFKGEFRTFKIFDRWGGLMYNIRNFNLKK